MVEWHGKRVVILGAARQGLALARYLATQGASVVLNDRGSAEQLETARLALKDLDGSLRYPLEWVFGAHPLELLDRADLLCLSGGVRLDTPIVEEARRRDIPLSNDSQIFLESVPCEVIGITGSAGKTTTTTLVGRIARAGYQDGNVWIGGNIGAPLIADLEDISSKDLCVMELSSFQLELMTLAPQVAGVLNVTPNHLDRHGTMKAYTAAKARILDYQTQNDWAVLNADDPGAWSLSPRVNGNLMVFGLEPRKKTPGVFRRGDEIVSLFDGDERALMPISEIELRGEHNLQNVLAASALSLAAGLPDASIREGVSGFSGVAHRLEYVRTWGGAQWYNDSIATAPERTLAAMRSFTEPLVLLAGGKDKDLPWDEFAAYALDHLKHLIVFGSAAGLIQSAIEVARTAAGSSGNALTLTHCSGLQEAVIAAARIVQPGDVVLLSPGGTSFDEFKDFEERGLCFRQLVMQL